MDYWGGNIKRQAGTVLEDVLPSGLSVSAGLAYSHIGVIELMLKYYIVTRALA